MSSKYVVAMASSLPQLKIEVEFYLNHGYSLQGGISVVDLPAVKDRRYYQALSK